MTKPTIAVIGSHSALDVCRGAKDEGFKTLVIAETGREKTYSEYYKTSGNRGCVDECIILNKFIDILKLNIKNVVFVPNRSFEAYCNFDYKAIEEDFRLPIFGNKYLLKIEERNAHPNQYDLMDAAGIRYPKHFKTPQEIDRLCLIKVSEASRPYERAFFLVNSFADFKKRSTTMIRAKKITKESLKSATIEEFVVGTPINFNFFYSPLSQKLELMGTDTRRQTNLDGILRIPAQLQKEVLDKTELTFEESGHIAVTVLESMLEIAFELGERFVSTAKKLYPPGIIGPFALQAIITSGPPRKDIVVIDISPRMPGSPGISSTPYGAYLYGQSISVGRRVAKEIRTGYTSKSLQKILT